MVIFTTGNFNAFAQVSANFTSAQFFSSELDPLTIQPAYTLVDATVGVTTSDRRYGVTLFVKNLFDENYYPSAHGDNNIQPGRPFSARFGIRLTM